MWQLVYEKVWSLFLSLSIGNMRLVRACQGLRKHLYRVFVLCHVGYGITNL